MIPKQLTLKNFLSYREVTLNFDGLHVACVCGPNGAGKSSLLEAIAWCVWGKSRVSAEDDIVRQGASEAQVSFCFEHSGQTYRIIRTRRRAQTSSLEFQLQASSHTNALAGSHADSHPNSQPNSQTGSQANSQQPTPFRSLTQKGTRATQQYILAQIKIDYETFVNTAYLRQGRADEFMLKRPSERKQVLADLLRLDHYDTLAEQAKDQARSYKAQLQPLEALITRLTAQIETREATLADYAQLEAQIKEQQKTEKNQKKQLNKFKQQQQQRNTWQQQLALLEQQQKQQSTALATTQLALQESQQALQQIEATLAQADEIQRQHERLTQLRQQEEQQAEQFHNYQQAQGEKLQLQQQISQAQQQQHKALAGLEGQLEQLQAQEKKLRATLEKKESISQKLAQLHTAKKQLHQLDKMEAESAPLRQRQRHIEGQIEQAHTRLVTRIEELDNRRAQVATQQTLAPQLMQATVEISHRIAHLEQRRAYQEALRQKGLERRSFLERLQANQRNYETELEKFDQRLKLLETSQEAHCPLCDQALSSRLSQDLRDRTLQARDDIQNQIWAIREQLAVTDSEIQVLRQEYRLLEDELANYAPILEERGQLKAKLASVETLQDKLQMMGAERAQLERCLQENDFAENLQSELQQLQTQISAMDYDDRNHALLRSQVDRLRWSELKYAEIKQAERSLKQIQTQRPQLEADLNTLKATLTDAAHSPDKIALSAVEQRLATLDYSLAQHDQIRAQLREAHRWQARYQALQEAKQKHATLQTKIAQLTATDKKQTAELARIAADQKVLQQQLRDTPASQVAIDKIELALDAHRQLRDQQLSQLGRLQQQLSQLETLEEQQQQQQQTLDDIRHKYQVYKSLAQAFGRSGIQTLMIENLLPQLEAQTNQILGRLSNHQLHVQFVTQRTGRHKSRSRKKLIDTLDILIADARGTRPYETYSGGEAFRVNFAIRLAIARLLAMRSGTALQMLIVDEGFGTQDTEGCDRLIAAIEAIAPDFACILTITHMPHFREAFQTRIDVSKDESGSHISLSA